MAGDAQENENDFRGLTFSHIEGEGLGELPSSKGLGWRTFLVFDRRNQRLARLNAVDFDGDTKRREMELAFGAKQSHQVFESILEHGQDDDSSFFVSSLQLESEPLSRYLEREAPLEPLHGFNLIENYLEALHDSAGFKLAPEGLAFFAADRLRIGSDDGAVRLVFCGFGAADDQDSQLSLQERVASLATKMGLSISPDDMPKEAGLGEILAWMGSFREDLEKEKSEVPQPESEIRKWLAESPERRDAVCESAPAGMAGLVADLEKKAEPDKKAEVTFEEPVVLAQEKISEFAEPTVKLLPKQEMRKRSGGDLLKQFQDRMAISEGDEVADLLPEYQASRQKRRSPMTVAFVFCALVTVLLWVVSLNLDAVADTISRVFGTQPEPRSGFQEYESENGSKE